MPPSCVFFGTKLLSSPLCLVPTCWLCFPSAQTAVWRHTGGSRGRPAVSLIVRLTRSRRALPSGKRGSSSQRRRIHGEGGEIESPFGDRPPGGYANINRKIFEIQQKKIHICAHVCPPALCDYLAVGDASFQSFYLCSRRGRCERESSLYPVSSGCCFHLIWHLRSAGALILGKLPLFCQSLLSSVIQMSSFIHFICFQCSYSHLPFIQTTIFLILFSFNCEKVVAIFQDLSANF